MPKPTFSTSLVAFLLAAAVPCLARSTTVAGVEAPSSIGALSAEAPMQVLPWYNGVFQNIGTNWACASDPPIWQVRVAGYAGYSLVPPDRTPAVGEVFYTHLVLSHPGNPCGGSAIGIELLLPAGVETANSEANPAFCFAVSGTNNRLFDLGNDSGYGCPQAYAQGLEGLAVRAPRGGIGGGAWGLGQGFWLELLVPLRATQVQFGDKNITWRVNPDLGVVGYPKVPLLVNGDVIFRDPMEGNVLMLDICGITPTPIGC
ncbi:hypothetical protein [Dokdonella sp.]|uniref:hypothetical protein n=1 Tax=Dokdonella sp. TaxID=2291710 RepID=UPI0026018B40|nr:hypothetical protein [Dokdonella sp.]